MNYASGSLVCPPCENVCEGKPPSLTSSSKTLSGHGGVADRYVSYKVSIWVMYNYIVFLKVGSLENKRIFISFFKACH